MRPRLEAFVRLLIVRLPRECYRRACVDVTIVKRCPCSTAIEPVKQRGVPLGHRQKFQKVRLFDQLVHRFLLHQSLIGRLGRIGDLDLWHGAIRLVAQQPAVDELIVRPTVKLRVGLVESLYEPYTQFHGGAYYELINGRLLRNQAYRTVPEIKVTYPAEAPNQGLVKQKPMYELIEEPHLLEFLTVPERHTALFDGLYSRGARAPFDNRYI